VWKNYSLHLRGHIYIYKLIERGLQIGDEVQCTLQLPRRFNRRRFFQSISESDHLGISRRLIKNWHHTKPLNGYFSSSQPKYQYQELMKACGEIVTTISQIFVRAIWQCLIHNGISYLKSRLWRCMFLSNLC
jgi:hypothetical protein